jgi:CBS domain-containing protein
MLQNNVRSILITENQKPVGIISDREILKEMVENRRDPEKTLTKEFKYTPIARCLVLKLCIEVGWGNRFVSSSDVFSCFSV